MTVNALISSFKMVVALSATGLSLLGSAAKAQDADTGKAPASVLTQFEVKKGQEKKFREALLSYVQHATAHTSNIMAEAYYEQEHPSVLWLIERWSNAAGQESMTSNEIFKLLKSGKKLVHPAKTIHIHDLEPLSKQEWSRQAAAEDQPVTIMLFVDSKPGTERQFMEVYHQAMPQFRGEPGVINYQLSRLAADSSQFVTYEKFRNEAAFQYHLNFPPIQPVIDYLNTSIKSQPFQQGLHRLIPLQ